MKLVTFLLVGLLACGDDSVERSQGADAGRDVMTADTAEDAGGDGAAGDGGETSDARPDLGDAPEPDAPADAPDRDVTEDAADVEEQDASDASDASDAGDDDVSDVEVDAGPGYDPAAAGPFDIVSQSDSVTRDGRTIPVNVHRPEGGLGRPMVVLLPGFQLETRRYLVLTQHLASHGYIVVRADPPGGLFDVDHTAMADDMPAVIDWALGVLGDAVDPESIVMMGHSLGGKLGFMTASRDSRIAAIFAIDPVNVGSPITGYSETLPNIVPGEVEGLEIPIGIVGETLDSTADFGPACAPAGMNYVGITDAATSATWLSEWTFTDAAHMDFVDDKMGCGFTCSACRDGAADEAQVRAGVRTLAVAFLRLHFDADAGMEAWLTGASQPPGVTRR